MHSSKCYYAFQKVQSDHKRKENNDGTSSQEESGEEGSEEEGSQEKGRKEGCAEEESGKEEGRKEGCAEEESGKEEGRKEGCAEEESGKEEVKRRKKKILRGAPGSPIGSVSGNAGMFLVTCPEEFRFPFFLFYGCRKGAIRKGRVIQGG